MPKRTSSTSDSIVLMRVGTSNRAANDAHLTIGKGSGSKSTYIGRAEVRIPEPDWPTGTGRLADAWMTVEERRDTSHTEWEGGSPRIVVRRMDERARFGVPSSADGHGSGAYTTEGQGDKYPGGSTAGVGIEANIHGKTTFKVTDIIRRMLPERLGGGNEQPWGYFKLTSSNEDSTSRSVVLSRRVVLTVDIDTRVIPGIPTILEVVGAQDNPVQGGPTLVATVDGRTLEVRFAFAAGAGETARSVTLEMRVAGATDAVPGTLVKSVTMTPLSGGGVDIYRARLTGVPQGTEGRFRLKATSSTGMEGPWTSFEDDAAHVQLATIPGAPVNVVVEPTIEDPDISASLPSTHPGSITGMQALVTLLPQGRVWDSGMEDIGGSLRRATLVYNGEALADGQQTSTRVRLRDEDGVVGLYGAPITTTHHAPPAATVPVITTAPQRFLTLRPTFNIAGSAFDGWRLRLLHETDDTIIVYDSGTNVVVDQTSVNVQVPASVLAYGQRFRAQVATVPDGGGTTYGDWTDPKPYSIAALPTMTIRAQDAVAGKVGVEDVTWLVTVNDPDGATLGAADIELRVADTPQGSGDLHRRWYGNLGAGTPILKQIPDGSVPFETAVDARVRGRNDLSVLASTTLNGAASATDTTITLTSAANFAIGQDIAIASTDGDEYEARRIANLVGTTVTLDEALAYAHASGQAVNAWQFGPWSPWVTVAALEPPAVDLLTPLDGATVTRPWQTLDWLTTGNGGRTQASAVVTLYDADGKAIATVDITGTTSVTTVPAYLLEEATDYAWDVAVIDSDGMTTTSERRTFTTAFTEPASITAVSVGTDVERGGLEVAWTAEEDADLHHYEVSWLDDSGAPVRIDGGPEEYGDGREPFTGTSLVHVGARLGENVYVVTAHNGWRGSEPTSGTGTLSVGDVGAGTWEAVTGAGEVIPLRVSDASWAVAAMMDTQHPPGGDSQAAHWGMEARRIPIRSVVLAREDAPLATTLRLLMADPARGRGASPAWLKAPAPWEVDPVWCVLSAFTPTPGPNGIMDVSMEWLEVGPPVHAILPPAPPVPPEGEPDIFVDVSELDFGDVEVT